jgi:thiosulfate/3-mercaptopyruvate sulfurtransferase
VPGALALDVIAELFDTYGQVVSAPELAMVMSALGVADGDTVVLVDHGRPELSPSAAFALRRYGHQDVHLLDGGMVRWQGEGRPVAFDVTSLPPASFTARVRP